MAFSFLSEANFEDGTLGHFDVESDSAGRLNFSHYSVLARDPRATMPYSGAYCMAIDLQTSTSNAYVQETGSWDMTAGTNEIYMRFMFYLSSDYVMANTNEFVIHEYWSGTNTAEAGVMVNYTTANGLRLGIGKGTASTFLGLTAGEWHTVEVYFNPAGGAGGTLDAWLDGAAFTQVASLTNANITSGILGVAEQDSGTTAGFVQFDEVIADDARVYAPKERYPQNRLLTKDGHVFVGNGIIDNITLLSGNGTDCVVTVYDTDTADTNDASNIVAELKNTAANEMVDPAGMPAEIIRGAYVVMSGTTPRALVQIGRAAQYGSDGVLRDYGNKRASA